MGAESATPQWWVLEVHSYLNDGCLKCIYPSMRCARSAIPRRCVSKIFYSTKCQVTEHQVANARSFRGKYSYKMLHTSTLRMNPQLARYPQQHRICSPPLPVPSSPCKAHRKFFKSPGEDSPHPASFIRATRTLVPSMPGCVRTKPRCRGTTLPQLLCPLLHRTPPTPARRLCPLTMLALEAVPGAMTLSPG